MVTDREILEAVLTEVRGLGTRMDGLESRMDGLDSRMERMEKRQEQKRRVRGNRQADGFSDPGAVPGVCIRGNGVRIPYQGSVL